MSVKFNVVVSEATNDNCQIPFCGLTIRELEFLINICAKQEDYEILVCDISNGE